MSNPAFFSKGLCWNPAGADLHLHVPNLRFNVDDVRVLYTATTALESVLSYLAGDLSFTVGEVTLSQQQLGMPAPYTDLDSSRSADILRPRAIPPEEYNGTEIPMVAGAVTVAYNLNSTISSSDPPLVLDR